MMYVTFGDKFTFFILISFTYWSFKKSPYVSLGYKIMESFTIVVFLLIF